MTTRGRQSRSHTAPVAQEMFEKAGFVRWRIQIVAPDGTVDAVDYWDAPDTPPHRLVSSLRPMAQLAVTAVKERLERPNDIVGDS
jgi:hypothetical protein